MNPEFSCPELQTLAPYVTKAVRLKADAEARLANLEAAKQALADAEARLAENFTEDDERAVSVAAAKVEELQRIVRPIANHGGPDGMCRTVLCDPDVYKTLARGFERRAKAIHERLIEARKQLGRRFHDLAVEGAEIGTFWADPEVQRLQPIVRTLAQEEQAAIVNANYAKQAAPRFTRTFGDLHACLTAPIAGGE